MEPDGYLDGYLLHFIGGFFFCRMTFKLVFQEGERANQTPDEDVFFFEGRQIFFTKKIPEKKFPGRGLIPNLACR